MRELSEIIDSFTFVHVDTIPIATGETETNFVEYCTKLFGNKVGVGHMTIFDNVTGNPPYQKNNEHTKDDPLFHYFYDFAKAHGTRYCLISPAKFLFNLGATPKPWNTAMCSDEHIKVVYYEKDARKVFPTTRFKGGITILLRDSTKSLGPIGEFRASKEMRDLVAKVSAFSEETLDTIISGQGVYLYTDAMHEQHPEVAGMLSKGHKYDIVTNALDKLNNIIFFEAKPDDGHEYVQVFGTYQKVEGRRKERVYHWIRKDFVNEPEGHTTYRVFIANANGSGKKLGEKLSEPVLCGPNVGFTQTFISIGAFQQRSEAEAVLQYLKTKFARMMLSALKKTQHTTAAKWKRVPIQDFTLEGTIDWTQTVADIDQQLYRKYGLTQEEIDFIESTAQSMS